MKMNNNESEIINLYYRLEHRNKDGNIIKITEGKSESFLRQFTQLVVIGITHAPQTIRDITNVERTIDSDQPFGPGNQGWRKINFLNAIGELNIFRGIVAGSGTTPVTMTQHALITPIPAGIGVGQLEYGTQTFTPVVTVEPDTTFDIVRVLRNGTAATITINEVAIYVLHRDWTFMIIRDVVTPHILAPGDTVTMRYTPRITL